MAQPLLDFLQGRAREALPFFRRGVAMGLGTNDIIVMVSERFPDILRNVARDIIQVLRGAITFNRIERLLGPDVPAPNELIEPNPSAMMGNYQYTVTTPGRVIEEAEFLTVTSAVALSPREIREAGAELFNSTNYTHLETPLVTPQNITIERGVRNGTTTTP